MYRVIIKLETEKSANFLKNQIEENNPLLDGKVMIEKDSEIKPLNEVIVDMEQRWGWSMNRKVIVLSPSEWENRIELGQAMRKFQWPILWNGMEKI